MITIKGSAGSLSIRSSQFRTYLGSKRIKSTFFIIEEHSAAASPGSASISPSSTVVNEPVPLTPHDEQLLISLTQKGVFNSEELMDMLTRPERRSIHLWNALKRQSGCSPSSAALVVSSLSSKSSITFSGRGWGHGVGMSQWGAKSLADAGWNYRRILQHYFPGTSLERVSN